MRAIIQLKLKQQTSKNITDFSYDGNQNCYYKKNKLLQEPRHIRIRKAILICSNIRFRFYERDSFVIVILQCDNIINFLLISTKNENPDTIINYSIAYY